MSMCSQEVRHLIWTYRPSTKSLVHLAIVQLTYVFLNLYIHEGVGACLVYGKVALKGCLWLYDKLLTFP